MSENLKNAIKNEIFQANVWSEGTDVRECVNELPKKHIAIANALANSILANIKRETAPSVETLEAIRVLNETKSIIGY